jgi:hypothetical protein
MTKTTDPNRYLDPEYRAKAHKSATLLGEPAATEFRAALHAIEVQARENDLLAEDDTGGEQLRYAVDALVTDLDAWLEDPDPADAYDKLLRVFKELHELVNP